MDDNDLFALMGEANDYHTRLKGYYICLTCGEYINHIPLKKADCPFCGKSNKLVMRLNSWQEQVTIGIWKDAGYYSGRRAGKKRGKGGRVA